MYKLIGSAAPSWGEGLGLLPSQFDSEYVLKDYNSDESLHLEE